MNEPPAFFIREGERFFATALTRGPWSPDLQHGGPGAALLARAIERLAGEGARVVRLTVELVRPIPIAPLEVTSAPIRGGKKVQVLGASVASGGKEIARATAVAIRRADVPLPPQVPRPAPAFAPPPPGRCAPFTFPFFSNDVGYHTAMEGRLARGEFGRGAMALWMRMRVPLVAGETPSALVRVAAAADSGNGVSVALDTRRYTFVNPDLTIYLHRPLLGEWVCLDAATTAGEEGVGLADTALHDERGPIGRSLQSLIIERRERE